MAGRQDVFHIKIDSALRHALVIQGGVVIENIEILVRQVAADGDGLRLMVLTGLFLADRLDELGVEVKQGFPDRRARMRLVDIVRDVAGGQRLGVHDQFDPMAGPVGLDKLVGYTDEHTAIVQGGNPDGLTGVVVDLLKRLDDAH